MIYANGDILIIINITAWNFRYFLADLVFRVILTHVYLSI